MENHLDKRDKLGRETNIRMMSGFLAETCKLGKKNSMSNKNTLHKWMWTKTFSDKQKVTVCQQQSFANETLR